MGNIGLQSRFRGNFLIFSTSFDTMAFIDLMADTPLAPACSILPKQRDHMSLRFIRKLLSCTALFMVGSTLPLYAEIPLHQQIDALVGVGNEQFEKPPAHQPTTPRFCGV